MCELSTLVSFSEDGDDAGDNVGPWILDTIKLKPNNNNPRATESSIVSSATASNNKRLEVRKLYSLDN